MTDYNLLNIIDPYLDDVTCIGRIKGRIIHETNLKDKLKINMWLEDNIIETLTEPNKDELDHLYASFVTNRNSNTNTNHDFSLMSILGKNEQGLLAKSYVKYYQNRNLIIKPTKLSIFEQYGDKNIMYWFTHTSNEGINNFEVSNSGVINNYQATLLDDAFHQKVMASRQGLRFKLRGSLEFKDDIFDRSAYKLDMNQHKVDSNGYIQNQQDIAETFTLKYKKIKEST